MTRLRGRRPILLVAGLVALLAIAVPAIGADPSPAGGPPDTPPGRENKPDKGPEIATTLTGTIDEATDAKGRPTFTITVDGVTWELSAGPKWYHGANNPLKAFVGRSVDVAGTYREGETELDVDTVNGEPIRAAGKPPWAGGPWAVGEGHPGWKAWRADGKPGHGYGREHAPGQLKKADDASGD